MARGGDDNLMSKLRQMSEDGLASFFNEVMSNDKMRSNLGRAGERFMANKQSFDRNVEQVLDFVNIPSKRDVRDLKTRLDHLSSQILNLSIKLDRLLDTDGAHVAFREMLAADRHAWRLHIGGRSHTVFNPAQCAVCDFWFQRFGFLAIGAGCPKNQPVTVPPIGEN